MEMISTLVLGPVTFHLYGLIMGGAMVVGWVYAGKLARQAGVKSTDFDKVAGVTLGGGILGARLYHVMDYWWYYRDHIAEVLAVWQGGLGIWGAVVGGVIGILISNYKLQISNKHQNINDKRNNLLIILDAAAAALPLAQAIGRWGNFINNELFGKPTSLPWKLWIPESSRPREFITVEYYHPLFLYESILNLLLFLGMRAMQQRGWVIGKRKFVGGYLIGYGTIRTILEPLRINSWRWEGMYVASWFGILAIIIGWMVIKIGNGKFKKI